MTTQINNFLMKKKINKLQEQATKIMGQDADLLIIAHKDGQFGTVKHGDADNIAQALFSCMYQPDNPIGKAVYRIIKLYVMNLFANSSSYAIDLTKSITNIIQNKDE